MQPLSTFLDHLTTMLLPLLFLSDDLVALVWRQAQTDRRFALLALVTHLATFEASRFFAIRDAVAGLETAFAVAE